MGVSARITVARRGAREAPASGRMDGNTIEPAREVVPSLRGSPLAGGWTQLATLVPQAAVALLGHGHQHASLPDGVDAVRLDVWSIMSSLTLLPGPSSGTTTGPGALDRIAKTDYQTVLVPVRKGRRQYGPLRPR